MATIITVHGTNASGPAEGSRWWQKTSPFEQRLRELVESADGDLKWEPLIWDGVNSETSRRTAGDRLCARALELEEKHEPYCVIGHSHGGSIVGHALMRAASKKQCLPHLKQWMTIGTPHILSAKARLLFSRLRLWGKSAYVAVAVFALIVLWLFFRLAFSGEGFNPSFWDNTIFNPIIGISLVLVGFVLLFAAPFIALYAVLWYINRRSLFMYMRPSIFLCNKDFGGRQVAIWHENDEAINGLMTVKSLKFNIFAKDFAVAPLMLISIFILPVALLYILYGRDPGALFMISTNYFFSFTDKLGLPRGLFGACIYFAVLLVVVPAGIFLLSLAVTAMAGVVARFLSDGLSRVLNRMTLAEIRAKAFGNDNTGETSTDARSYPAWMASGSAPLPMIVGGEITATSNKEAAQSIAKMRDALHTLTFADEKDGKTNFIGEYLSWNELIHCCYFESPRFRKLVAFALSQAEGFRPTSQFKSDPEYAEVASWFQEICPNRIQGENKPRL